MLRRISTSQLFLQVPNLTGIFPWKPYSQSQPQDSQVHYSLRVSEIKREVKLAATIACAGWFCPFCSFLTRSDAKPTTECLFYGMRASSIKGENSHYPAVLIQTSLFWYPPLFLLLFNDIRRTLLGCFLAQRSDSNETEKWRTGVVNK